MTDPATFQPLRDVIADTAAELSNGNPFWTAGCMADALIPALDAAGWQIGRKVGDDVVARALATADGLDFDEVCGHDTEADECDSSSCIATHWEDHDAEQARRWYLHLARAAKGAVAP